MPTRSLAQLSILLFCVAPALAFALHGRVPARTASEAAPNTAEAPATPAIVVTGRFEVLAGQRVLTLWGTPRERGFAHGYLLAESIVRGIEHDFQRVLKPLIPTYESMIRKVVVPQFKFSSRELEELEGLLAGLQARLPPKQRVVKVLKREFDLFDIKALNTFGDWYGLGCSSLAAWGELTKDGRTLVGRNFDFPGFDLLLGHQYVVVRAPDGAVSTGGARGQVGISYPGCIGLMTGMNEAGVFIAVHDVRIKPSLDKAFRPNVPRLIAVRRLLEQTHGPQACLQARDLARTWPTLYGNNLMVVAPGVAKGAPRAAVLEYDCRTDLEGGCTMRLSNGERALQGVSGSDLPAVCLACTNHHRGRKAPDGYSERYKRWRFAALAELGASAEAAPFDVTGIFAHIGKASFPREGPQALAWGLKGPSRAHGTLHQVVGEPDRRMLHVRLGVVGKNIRDLVPRAYDVAVLVWDATLER